MSELHIETPADEPLIVLRKLVKAPPELVFRLYTEPEHLRRWWGPRHLELVIDQLDVRVGGRYRFVHRAPDGQEFAFSGTYLEIDPPHRLVKTFVYEGKPDDQAVDRYTFEPVGPDTLIRLRKVHPSIASRDAHFESGAAPGLTAAYERQEELLASLPRGASS